MLSVDNNTDITAVVPNSAQLSRYRKNLNTDRMNASFIPFVSFDFTGNIMYLQLHLWHGTDRRFLYIIIPSP
jgi:hypothetical protein